MSNLGSTVAPAGIPGEERVHRSRPRYLRSKRLGLPMWLSGPKDVPTHSFYGNARRPQGLHRHCVWKCPRGAV